MLSTDSDSSSRYAAKYSAAAVGGCVMAIHTPTPSPSETHHTTQGTLRFVVGVTTTGECHRRDRIEVVQSRRALTHRRRSSGANQWYVDKMLADEPQLQLIRANHWSSTTLKIGETIAVDFSPAKDGCRIASVDAFIGQRAM